MWNSSQVLFKYNKKTAQNVQELSHRLSQVYCTPGDTTLPSVDEVQSSRGHILGGGSRGTLSLPPQFPGGPPLWPYADVADEPGTTGQGGQAHTALNALEQENTCGVY